MKIAFLFYENMTALDAIGPHEILSRLPQAETFRAAKRKGPIRTDSGLTLVADYDLSEIKTADILLVPGGGNGTSLSHEPEILQWIQSIHEATVWTTSVCTGSLILGAAGILTNLRATTHWAALERLKAFHAHPVQARVVEDGKVMTAAGVSAGIDMALVLSSKVAGDDFAQTIQLALEYDPNPPFDTGSFEKANPALREALRQRMTAKFEPLHSNQEDV